MDARVEKRLSAENSVLNTNPLLKPVGFGWCTKHPFQELILSTYGERESDNVIGNWSPAYA